MYINQLVQDAINEQINKELYSAYLYLAMSAYLEVEGYSGFASWTRKQAKEETEHAMKFFDFVNERGGNVLLQVIDKPTQEFGTPLQTFEEILKHEQKVTSSINALYEIALEQRDYATQVMLHWFIDEQVEEEENAGQMVDKLKIAGDSIGAILQLDREAGSRD